MFETIEQETKIDDYSTKSILDKIGIESVFLFLFLLLSSRLAMQLFLAICDSFQSLCYNDE